MSHPLDKPIWTALATRQARFDASGTLAKRFPEEVSPLAAARDASAEAVAALAGRIGEGGDISLLEVAPPAPPHGIEAQSAAAVQMVAKALTPGGRRIALLPLGDEDAPEMLDLATLTRPGPFRANTHKLGRFFGIRDGSRLVAMGGERLAMDGLTEVSGICTHPEYRGRGFGEALLRAVADRILQEGATPFLHAYAGNVGAIGLYKRAGFEVRTEVTHAIWRRAA